MRKTIQSITDATTDVANHEKPYAIDEILAQLVAYRTVTGNRAAISEALDFIEEFVTARGMHTERFTFNSSESLYASSRGTKTPSTLLNGHIDVIVGRQDQFELIQEAGTYRARGAFDMKAGLASYLQIIDILKENIAAYDFGLMVTADEETGGYNGALKLIERGYIPKQLCIIPDGGDNWQLETFAKGIWFLRIKMDGVSAHGSRPWEGSSALDSILGLLGDIRALFPPVDTNPATSTMTIGTLKSGTVVNKLPDSAVAELDIRTGSLTDHYKIIADIESLCAQYGAHCKVLAQGIPCVNSTDDRYIRLFAHCMQQVRGIPTATTHSYAGTDGRHFSAVGVPCAIVRPPGGGHHGPNEWISIEGVNEFTRIVRKYLESAEQQPIIDTFE